ncbi:MAG: hypothetical protein KDD94_10260, partial [Calditrichaeota bacterium]|nr:hypothetical protein [Calditrichota bacterium]
MVLLYFGFVLFQLSNSSEFRFTDDFKSVAFSAAYKVTGASAATRHHQLIPIVHNGKAAYMYIVT